MSDNTAREAARSVAISKHILLAGPDECDHHCMAELFDAGWNAHAAEAACPRCGHDYHSGPCAEGDMGSTVGGFMVDASSCPCGDPELDAAEAVTVTDEVLERACEAYRENGNGTYDWDAMRAALEAALKEPR